ncbi:hypothetical protein, partial [Terrihalobacillus insolitus]|uniref:hypothetical protein n=1 Tax=Terrihalobacillus insolitus TaxID=2950438 RepID=UPI00234160AA
MTLSGRKSGRSRSHQGNHDAFGAKIQPFALSSRQSRRFWGENPADRALIKAIMTLSERKTNRSRSHQGHHDAFGAKIQTFALSSRQSRRFRSVKPADRALIKAIMTLSGRKSCRSRSHQGHHDAFGAKIQPFALSSRQSRRFRSVKPAVRALIKAITTL